MLHVACAVSRRQFSVSSTSPNGCYFRTQDSHARRAGRAAPFAERAGRIYERRVRHPASRACDLSRGRESAGACLIVGVNSDASVRMLGKGDDRPINNEADRMALLAALESVDYVVCFGEKTPVELISALRPDVLVKGGDYDMDALPESAVVRGWGGKRWRFRSSTTARPRRCSRRFVRRARCERASAALSLRGLSLGLGLALAQFDAWFEASVAASMGPLDAPLVFADAQVRGYHSPLECPAPTRRCYSRLQFSASIFRFIAATPTPRSARPVPPRQQQPDRRRRWP